MTAPDRPTLLACIRFRDAGTLLGLVLIGVVFSTLPPVFLTTPNLMNIPQQSSINPCIALGMTLVIISRGIDLSVGPITALSAVLGAAIMVAGVPVPLAVLGALGVGAACGLFNGVLIAWGGLQPFIVTLSGLSLFRAFALIYTGGTPIFGIPPVFVEITNGTLAGVPNPVLIVAVLATLAWVILNRTHLGEYMMAVGGNEEAARISGVPVKLTKIAAYLISGVMAAVSAMILIGRLGAAEPTLGTLGSLTPSPPRPSAAPR